MIEPTIPVNTLVRVISENKSYTRPKDHKIKVGEIGCIVQTWDAPTRHGYLGVYQVEVAGRQQWFWDENIEIVFEV